MRFKDFLKLFDGSGEGGQDGGIGNGSGNSGGGAAGSAGGVGATYSFEQAEEIATKRADRASRAALADFFRQQGMTEAEVTSAIADYKEKKKAQEPDVAAIAKERDEAREKLAAMENATMLRKKGVREEDIDYVAFKTKALMAEDDKLTFEKAAEKFLKDNSRYVGGGREAYKVITSPSSGGSGAAQNTNDLINSAIRDAIRR